MAEGRECLFHWVARGRRWRKRRGAEGGQAGRTAASASSGGPRLSNPEIKSNKSVTVIEYKQKALKCTQCARLTILHITFAVHFAQ